MGTMWEEYYDTLAVYNTLLWEYLDWARTAFNRRCIDLEPWQVVAYTLSACCLAIWLHAVIWVNDKSLLSRLKLGLFKFVRRLPGVEQRIQRELIKVRRDVEETVHKCDPRREFVKILPDKGWRPAHYNPTQDDILYEAERYDKMGTFAYDKGRVSGAVYTDLPLELLETQKRIYELYAYTNPLHPDVFPGARKMEAEVVRMVINLFNGGLKARGCCTSGGTESILLACLAYRNLALERGIDKPEMVIPVTAHAAFDKAGWLFGIRVKHVAIDADTMQVNVWAMRRAISANTCMLVGSAPTFPHGTIDPLDEISRLGQRYNVPVHVDACLGGFLLPFMEQSGYAIGPFDFRLPGVMSISCDTHKYGFTPKGSSVVMFRNDKYMHAAYFSQTEWPGGIYASPTLAGSRSGLAIALTWATMLYYGKDGYRRATEAIVETTQKIRTELEQIEGLSLYGTSEVSVVAIGSEAFNVYQLVDELRTRGWNLNSLQHPPAFHLAVTLWHTMQGVADSFISDVRECTMNLLNNPKPASASKTAAMYGMATSLPDRGLVAECAFAFLDACYSTYSPGKDERKTSRVNSYDPYSRRESMDLTGAQHGDLTAVGGGGALYGLIDRLAKLSEETAE